MFSNVFIIYELNVIEFGTAAVAFETKSSYCRVAPGGGEGHLGTFWVGMCRPGLQIGTLFQKNFPLKLIPRSRNGPIFYTSF